MGLAIAGLGVAFVGLAGVAHTPWGRPLLAYLPGMGACPVGMDVDLSPQERDALRQRTLASLRGRHRAASRRVFGFELGRATLGEVHRWAQHYDVSCSELDNKGQLRCEGVASAALEGTAAAERLLLQFDGAQRLVAIDVSRRAARADEAAAFVSDRSESLAETVGPAAVRSGEASAEHLGSGRLSQAKVEFRFADLRSSVVATNMGKRGYVLRELHQALSTAGERQPG